MTEVIPSVYVFQRGPGLYKVGFSCHPESRRKQFGWRTRILRTWPTPYAWQVERISHWLLNPHRAHDIPGVETYRAPLDVVFAAIEEAVRRSEDRPGVQVWTAKPVPAPPFDPTREAALDDLAEKYAKKMEAIRERK